MQSYHTAQPQPAHRADGLIHTSSLVTTTDYPVTEDSAQTVNEPTQFYSHFVDSMEMFADAETVSRYLDTHHEWFRRCAHPMQVDSIGPNSYALVIGKYGSFGYEVEPKIGLDLLPQDAGIYRIETVPVPGYDPGGYDVDFKAAMALVETQPDEAIAATAGQSVPPLITRVEWSLDLTVYIQFPRFIQALPKSLIQSTGDRLLQQVVRQVSGRLTRKVLEDFHQSHDLPLPKRSKRWFFRKAEGHNDSLEAED